MTTQTLPISLKLDLIVDGYVRKHGKEHQINIPQDLNMIILAFHQRSYKAYAIGRDSYHQWEYAPQYEAENKEPYEVYKRKKKFVHLKEFSKRIESPEFISVSYNNVFIRNTNDEIYAIGRNAYGALGINQSEIQEMDTFTKVQSPALNNFQIHLMSQT